MRDIAAAEQTLTIKDVLQGHRRILQDVIHREKFRRASLARLAMEVQPNVLGQALVKLYKLIDSSRRWPYMIGRRNALVAKPCGLDKLLLRLRLFHEDLVLIEGILLPAEMRDPHHLPRRAMDEAGLPAPAHSTARSDEQAMAAAAEIGFPVLVRPSYVLGGRGMEIVYQPGGLIDYLNRAGAEPGGAYANGPLLIDRFLDDAIEIDVDALYDGSELFLGGVMEHIEEAGIHSGDSACVLPPMSLSDAEIARVRRCTQMLADGVGVRGLINVQFALMSDTLYVIEANPRASRTVPFVSKATGVQLAKAAALIMAGESIASLKSSGHLPQEDAGVTDPYDPIAVKEAVLPFKRFRTPDGRIVDTVLGPEMRSTGEVMGYDIDFPRAFAKSQASAYGGLPGEGTLFVSVTDRDKRAIILPVARLAELGFTILATTGTAQVLRRNGIPATPVRKLSEGRGEHGERTIVELIESDTIDMVVNTPKGQGARADGYAIRAAATSAGRPIITTVQELQAVVQALEAQLRGPFRVRSLQEHGTDRIARLQGAAKREVRL